MTTLLEQAKKVSVSNRSKKDVSGEEIELMLAYLKGEVSASQASVILYPNDSYSIRSGRLNARFVPVIKEACRRGLIKF